MTGSIQKIEKLVQECGRHVRRGDAERNCWSMATRSSPWRAPSAMTISTAPRAACATRSSCLAQKSSDLAPVAVHADALRLFAPKKGGPTGDAAEGVLAELARVLAHYRNSQGRLNSLRQLGPTGIAATGCRPRPAAPNSPRRF